MDYFRKVEEAIKFTWKYKALWVFGFIASIFGGGNFSNYNFPSSYDSGDSELTNKVEDFFDNPGAVILVVVLMLIGLLVALVGWYLNSVAKAALVNSVKMDKEGGRPTLRGGWDFGRTLAFRIMWMDIIGFGISLVVVIPVLAIVFLGIVFPPFFALFCLLIPVIIILAILWAIVYTGALRYLVLKDMDAWDSIVAGWELAKNTITEYVVGGLVSILTGCIWGIVIVPIAMVLGVAFLLFALFALVANPFIAVLLIVFGLVITVSFTAVINSPYAVFSSAYWTKVVMELMDRYDR